MAVGITFRIPPKNSLEQVRFLTIEVSPVSFLTGEATGEKASPVGFGVPLYEGDRGTGAVLPRSVPLTRPDTGSRPPREGGTPGRQPILTREEELAEIMEVIAELSAQVRDIEDILAEPNAYDTASRQIIRRSHGGDPETVLALDFSSESKDRRKAEYNSLAVSAFAFGPQRSERRRLMAQVKVLGRSAAALKKQIAKKRRTEDA